MDVFTDQYMLKKKKFEGMKKWGMKVCPVDMNGGYVALDKYGSKNIEETQDNIHERFSLESRADEDKEGGDY